MTATQEKDDSLKQAREQALCQYEVIDEMITRLAMAKDDDEREAIEQEIQETSLEVSVRDGWHAQGEEAEGPEEYLILLCTGGPAVRIIGDLENGIPSTARLECQSWFTPWTEVCEGVDRVILRDYARQFYFKC